MKSSDPEDNLPKRHFCVPFDSPMTSHVVPLVFVCSTLVLQNRSFVCEANYLARSAQSPHGCSCVHLKGAGVHSQVAGERAVSSCQHGQRGTRSTACRETRHQRSSVDAIEPVMVSQYQTRCTPHRLCTCSPTTRTSCAADRVVKSEAGAGAAGQILIINRRIALSRQVPQVRHQVISVCSELSAGWRCRTAP